MDLPFLNRTAELARLHRAYERNERLVVLYGRRRLGKSRLLTQSLLDQNAAYWVADQRGPPLQRASLARELSRRIDRFDAVIYPDWEALLDRLFSSAPPGLVLVLDEVPELVRVSPEFPGLLQKHIDRSSRGLTVVLCGSSQTMMQGLVLDSAAPLYGRAAEIIRVEPLTANWLEAAFRDGDARVTVERWAVFGGVPRYWELAQGRPPWEAVRELVLDPQGPLHREPSRLLRDDVSDLVRAESVLALIGQGCHRVSEIASRLSVPAGDLSRPLSRLVDLGFVTCEVPFGRSRRDTKRTLYRLDDPFLAFWYRFVDPNRSLLEARQVDRVLKSVQTEWRPHFGHLWESLCRQAVPRMALGDRRFGVANRYWVSTRSERVELDMVAAVEGAKDQLFVGEAKLILTASSAEGLLADLRRRAGLCPELQVSGRVPTVDARLFVLDVPSELRGDPRIIGPDAVLGAFVT